MSLLSTGLVRPSPLITSSIDLPSNALLFHALCAWAGSTPAAASISVTAALRVIISRRVCMGIGSLTAFAARQEL
jgi:hypothetical protein